ncbi:hypothetical protein JG687_00017137 [Phytophthora cactorum]|uniref:Uncharacterized protein n=1 Tax=Phytophthora cactorum TaxID=29920 RepID=A0A8T1TQK7_9STRA|nr:hypothetical protein JG687_00017137 [Phytophthora cactorum]
MVLRDEYPDVGFVRLGHHGFVLPDQKRRVAGEFGASKSKYKRVVGIINTGHHWVAFLIDKEIERTTKKARCTMFNPHQSKSNYDIIEKSIRTVLEELLQLQRYAIL